jgi:hypothetical protein
MSLYSILPVRTSVNLTKDSIPLLDILRSGQTRKLVESDCDCSSDCACVPDGVVFCQEDHYSDYALKFQNHENVLKKILSIAYHQIVLDAPAGYGKTYLLREVEKRLKQKSDEWKFGIIDLSYDNERKKTQTEIRKEIVRTLGLSVDFNQNNSDILLFAAIKRLPKFVLMFDSVEYDTDGQLVAWLQENFVAPFLRIREKEYLFIFSGRYLYQLDSPYKWKEYKKFVLSHIKINDIFDALNDAYSWVPDKDKQGIAPETFLALSENIAWLSAGHPGSINNLVRKEWLPSGCAQDFSIQMPSRKFKSIFKSCVHPYVENLKEELGEEMFSLLRSVSVFRMMDQNILRELQSRKLIGAYQQAWSKILAIHLFINRGFFWMDGVARQLVARDLELLYPDEYHRLNHVARETWEAQLEHLMTTHADFPNRSSLIENMLRNILYQSLGEGLNEGQLIEIIANSLWKLGQNDGLENDELMTLFANAIQSSQDDDWMENLEFERKLTITFDKVKICLLEIQHTKGCNVDLDGAHKASVQNDRSVSVAIHGDVTGNLVIGDDNTIGRSATTMSTSNKEEIKKNSPLGEQNMEIKIESKLLDTLADALDFLRHNAQNILLERWERRNGGKASTPPIFKQEESANVETIKLSLQQYKVELPGSILVDARNIIISESHIQSLRSQMQKAQKTKDAYAEESANVLGLNEKIQVKQQMEQYQQKIDEAASELADILVYIYSPKG